MKRTLLIVILSASLLIGCQNSQISNNKIALDNKNKIITATSVQNTSKNHTENNPLETSKAEVINESVNDEEQEIETNTQPVIKTEIEVETDMSYDDVVKLLLQNKSEGTKDTTSNKEKIELFPFNKLVNNKLKWGYINSTGEEVVSATFDRTYDINEDGYGKISKDGLYGVIDNNKNIVHQPIFNELYLYSKDFLLGTSTTDNFIIVKNNKNKILGNVTKIEKLNKDFCVLFNKDNYKVIIDKYGNELIKLEEPYNNIGVFQNKFIYAMKRDEHNKLTLFTINGEELGSCSELAYYEIQDLWNLSEYIKYRPLEANQWTIERGSKGLQIYLKKDDTHMPSDNSVTKINENFLLLKNNFDCCQIINKKGERVLFSPYLKSLGKGIVISKEEDSNYFLGKLINIENHKSSDENFYYVLRLSDDRLFAVTPYGSEILDNNFNTIKKITIDYYTEYKKEGNLIKGMNSTYDKSVYLDYDGNIIWEGLGKQSSYTAKDLDILTKNEVLDPFCRRSYPIILNKGYEEVNNFMEKISCYDVSDSEKQESLGRFADNRTVSIVKLNNILKITYTSAGRVLGGTLGGTFSSIYYLTKEGKEISQDNIFTGDYKNILTEKIKTIMIAKNEDKPGSFWTPDKFEFNEEMVKYDFEKDKLILNYSSYGVRKGPADFTFSYKELNDILNLNHPIINSILNEDETNKNSAAQLPTSSVTIDDKIVLKILLSKHEDLDKINLNILKSFKNNKDIKTIVDSIDRAHKLPGVLDMTKADDTHIGYKVNNNYVKKFINLLKEQK